MKEWIERTFGRSQHRGQRSLATLPVAEWPESRVRRNRPLMSWTGDRAELHELKKPWGW